MIKIYLDTNIYAKLKLPENKERLSSLVSLAANKAMFCYSQAHLNDLHQDKSEKKFFDLETIDLLCHDSFLNYDDNKDSVTSLLAHPIEAYDEYKPDDSTLGSLMEDFLNPDDSEDELLSAFKSLLQVQEIDLELDKYPQNQTPEAIDILARVGITKSKYSMLEMMEVATKFLDAFQTDEKLIRDIRRLSQVHMQTQKFKINIDEVDFNQRVEKTLLGKSFLNFLEEQLENSKQKDGKISFFQRFTTAYSLINLLGFDSEKNKKVRFVNTQHDGQHSYYATICDVVVSDDEGFRQKTKFLYNLYGFNISVYSFEEFISHTFLLFKNEIFSVDSFLRVLNHDLSHGFVVSNTPSIKHEQSSQIIKLNHYYFSHFDRISVVKTYENEDQYIILYKDEGYLFFADFRAVTNLVSKTFGIDDNLRGEFQIDEINDVKNETWEGRVWTFTNFTFKLIRNQLSQRINLLIGPIKSMQN